MFCTKIPKLILILLIGLLNTMSLLGQTGKILLTPNEFQCSKFEYCDSTNGIEKKYMLAATELVALNIGVWAISKYFRNSDWTEIGTNSMVNNFKMGFTWDNDSFEMNQFFHPYHGASYYNTARSNGLNFWESSLYVFGGSLMWEYLMETERPSYNDLLNTTVSGISLGEISNRVSNLIIDENTKGFERFFREFTATLINPMQGFNRLIKGDMWKLGSSPKLMDFHFAFASGIHNVYNNNESRTYLALRVNLDYGNKFAVSSHKKPFDYFTLQTEANIKNGSDIYGIFASGVISDRKIKLFETSKNIIGIYKEVDILYNDVYKFSSTSVSGQIINTIQISSTANMQNYFGIAAIILGATNSLYSKEEGKEYNLGPGISGKIGIKFQFYDLFEYYINYKRNWIHTISGAESEEFIGLLNTGLSFITFGKNSVGLEFLLYERFGNYKYFPNTKDSNSALRFYIKQSI